MDLTHGVLNRDLKNALQALKFEVQQDPRLLGSTVLGYDDVYMAYQPFAQAWRQQLSCDAAQPYILTVDITKAFNAIQIERLLKLAIAVLQHSDYLMVKYASVSALPTPPKQSDACSNPFQLAASHMSDTGRASIRQKLSCFAIQIKLD